MVSVSTRVPVVVVVVVGVRVLLATSGERAAEFERRGARGDGAGGFLATG